MAEDRKAEGVVCRRKAKKTNDSEENIVQKEMKKETKNIENVHLQTGTYWLTRIVLLRAIGFVYSKLYIFVAC